VKKIAVFASGRGSNFIKIYENIKSGRISAKIACVISNNPDAGAIDFAQKNAIKTYLVIPKNFSTSELFGSELLKILEKNEIDWIILAGYLKKIPDNVVQRYANRIVNIHPALLPAFGGKGMYGMHVHQAVFNSGTKISGVTVHLVNEIYDSGPIVMQRAVDIEDCRNPDEIAISVLAVEHKVFSEAIGKLFTQAYRIDSNRVIFAK
jgi:formyltetrahydrofolate-dependent phosphoribosylglycinamide formyltransferase